MNSGGRSNSDEGLVNSGGRSNSEGGLVYSGGQSNSDPLSKLGGLLKSGRLSLSKSGRCSSNLGDPDPKFLSGDRSLWKYCLGGEALCSSLHGG